MDDSTPKLKRGLRLSRVSKNVENSERLFQQVLQKEGRNLSFTSTVERSKPKFSTSSRGILPSFLSFRSDFTISRAPSQWEDFQVQLLFTHRGLSQLPEFIGSDSITSLYLTYPLTNLVKTILLRFLLHCVF